MDDLQRLLVERACARLVVSYCHLVDHGEAGRVAELFAEDGVWVSSEARMEGRTAIARGFMRRQQNRARMSRHVCDNLLVEVDDERSARGVAYLTLYRHDGAEDRGVSPAGPPVLVGEYRDTFVLTDDGWRFGRREVSADFVGTGA